MINLSLLIIFVFSVSYLQGASEQLFIWQQPVIGTLEEKKVISNFNRVPYKQSDNSFNDDNALYNLISNPACFEQIKKEIEYRISQRIDEAKKLENKLTDDISLSLPIFEQQTFWDEWWHKKPLKYTSTDVKVLCPLDAEPSINDEVSQEDLNKMYINGLAHRAQLYAQLYNQLHAIKERSGEVSVLHIELLFDVCEGLKPNRNENEKKQDSLSRDNERLYVNFLRWKKSWLTARDRLLVQGDQRLLSPVSKPGLYTVAQGAVRALLISYPPYVNDNDYRAPNDDVEADTTHRIGRNCDEDQQARPDPAYDNKKVVGSRALYRHESGHNKIPYYNIRFCDALFGFDCLCIVDADNRVSFDYCASQWITTDTGTDKEKNISIFGYKIKDDYYIAKVDLPQSSKRQYCIYMLRNPGDQKVNILHLKMPIISEKIDTKNICNCGSNKIDAVAYDVKNSYMLYASNNSLIRGWPKVAFENGSKSHTIHQFKNSIKKIYVVSANAYLVVEKDNTLHAVFYAKNSKIQPIQLPMQDIIDIAYDVVSNKLVVLTKTGVFSYTCVTSKQCSDTVGPKTEAQYQGEGRGKALRSFMVALSDTRGGNPVIDVQLWNMELQDRKEIKNDSFAYDKYTYHAIEIHNGQIYLKAEISSFFRQKKFEKVLIYPQLSD